MVNKELITAELTKAYILRNTACREDLRTSDIKAAISGGALPEGVAKGRLKAGYKLSQMITDTETGAPEKVRLYAERTKDQPTKEVAEKTAAVLQKKNKEGVPLHRSKDAYLKAADMVMRSAKLKEPAKSELAIFVMNCLLAEAGFMPISISRKGLEKFRTACLHRSLHTLIKDLKPLETKDKDQVIENRNPGGLDRVQMLKENLAKEGAYKADRLTSAQVARDIRGYDDMIGLMRDLMPQVYDKDRNAEEIAKEKAAALQREGEVDRETAKQVELFITLFVTEQRREMEIKEKEMESRRQEETVREEAVAYRNKEQEVARAEYEAREQAREQEPEQGNTSSRNVPIYNRRMEHDYWQDVRTAELKFQELPRPAMEKAMEYIGELKVRAEEYQNCLDAANTEPAGYGEIPIQESARETAGIIDGVMMPLGLPPCGLDRYTFDVMADLNEADPEERSDIRDSFAAGIIKLAVEYERGMASILASMGREHRIEEQEISHTYTMEKKQRQDEELEEEYEMIERRRTET